jgi:hypothetical protein
MKNFNWMAKIAGGIVVMFIALVNLTLAADSLHQPISAVQTAYEYDGYLNTTPPLTNPNSLAFADSENPPETPAAEQPSSEEPEGEPEGFETGDVTPPEPPPAWHLPQPIFLQEQRIAMGGWVEQGITGNARSPIDRYNGAGFHTNDRSAEYQLNQAWLFFNRPIANDGQGWDWGGRVDVVYGSDWRCANTFGLENRINGAYQFYGIILPQFYLDLAYNDLTVRMGHWAPLAGYEVVPAVANFFYSHEYGMCSQPLLVTGVEGIYKLTDQLSITAGMNRGWFMFEDNNHTWDAMGGIEWISLDKRTDIKFNIDSGPQDTAGDDNRFVYTLVASHKLTERYTYALEHDWGKEINGSPYGGNAYWYSLAQYLFYTINPHWSTGLRVEWFRDNNGGRIAGLGNAPLTRGWTGGPGFVGDFTELTLGVNWRPNANWVLRPEIRWDWYNGSRDVHGNLPYADGTRSDQFTFATDLIATF